jgi:hypothetical protein
VLRSRGDDGEEGVEVKGRSEGDPTALKDRRDVSVQDSIQLRHLVRETVVMISRLEPPHRLDLQSSIDSSLGPLHRPRDSQLAILPAPDLPGDRLQSWTPSSSNLLPASSIAKPDSGSLCATMREMQARFVRGEVDLAAGTGTVLDTLLQPLSKIGQGSLAKSSSLVRTA